MKIENAIKYLRESKCDQHQGDSHQKYHNEVLDLAINALEKQIPKKINETPAFQSYFSAGDESECICPSCEFELNIEEQVNYCPECGQKLDWRN